MSVLLNGTSGTLDTGTGRPWMQNVGAGSACGWIKTVALVAGQFQTLVGAFGNTGTTRFKISINGTGNVTWRCNALDADATSVINSTNAVSPSARTHIAAVVNFSTKSGIIYINGVADPSGVQVFTNMTAGNTSNTACAQSAVGSREDGAANFFNGELEDVRIYNRGLGPDEIMTIFTGLGMDMISTGLQARWPMAELGQGVACTNITDISNNGFGGVAAGSPTYQPGITTARSAYSRQITGW
jgi:hypothetical protein